MLEANLAAADAADPALGALLRRAPPADGLRFLSSPAGLPVPARVLDGRPLPYHSTADPLREGRRLAGLLPPGGYTVVLGLGGGYHLAPMLADPALSRLLVFEPDAGLARSVMEHIDLREVILDPRTRILAGQPPQAAGQAVLADYLPAVHGGLRIVPLRTAFEERPGLFREAASGVREAAELAAADFAVQGRLGRRWFLNTLANLKAAGSCTGALQPIERAVVSGAGPSLERQVSRIAGLREKSFLIATDASLPALRGFGLTPDLVVSIDCQWASYHHFLQGLPPGVPLALDLASPPLLGRLAPRALYFAGGHPLSRYVSANWRALPELDTSGGNVAQAAVALAVSLGAREVLLAGLDFGFPAGKAYCRGTFLYRAAGLVETRLQPVESWFASFMLENRGSGQARYTSRPLSLYRARLEAFARSSPARLAVLPGAEIELDLREGPAGPGPQSALSAGGGYLWPGAPSSDWKTFLSAYASGLEALPDPSPPASVYLQRLAPPQRALWMMLLPAAAALRESQARGEQQAHRLLALTRDWSLAGIRRRLGS